FHPENTAVCNRMARSNPGRLHARSSADITPPARGVDAGSVSRRGAPRFLRHRQAASPRTHFGTRTVAVHAGALAALDHLGSTHPDVGHEVAGPRPYQVTQELVVIQRGRETGVVST